MRVVPQALAKVLEVVHCEWLAKMVFLLVNGGLREETGDGYGSRELIVDATCKFALCRLPGVNGRLGRYGASTANRQLSWISSGVASRNAGGGAPRSSLLAGLCSCDSTGGAQGPRGPGGAFSLFSGSRGRYQVPT